MTSPHSAGTMAGSQTCSTQTDRRAQTHVTWSTHILLALRALSYERPPVPHVFFPLRCSLGKATNFQMSGIPRVKTFCFDLYTFFHNSCAFGRLYVSKGLQDLPNYCFGSKNSCGVQEVTHRLLTN